MSKSIGRSQAAALAEGFLNSQGSTKDSFQPRETFTQLFLLAGKLVESAQDNLNQNHSNGSGSLSESLEVQEPEQSGSIVRADITMNFYGRFVNKGVKGTVSGDGLYAFKNNYFSKEMIKSLEVSKSKSASKITSTNPRKSVSQVEKKSKSISDVSSAYGAAINIKKYGIKATGFIDKAIIKTQSITKDILGKALKVDIINSLGK